MGKTLITPAVQHRYLEPYKNRSFQYDTKQSNYFLAQYVNQVLNAIGNDCIVRGLNVEAKIDPYKTGIMFTVNPGAMVQDTTYIELPMETELHLDDVINYPGCFAVVFTDWRYIQTTYPNELKLMCGFYNPNTRRMSTEWDTYRNRIILGVFSYTIKNNEIQFIAGRDDDLYIIDSNIIKNGTFDAKLLSFWNTYNSSMLIVDDGSGYSGTPYLEISPSAGNEQGISQVLETKINYNYEVSFFLRSQTMAPVKVVVTEGTDPRDLGAPIVKEFHVTSPLRWEEFRFQFSAVSNNSVIFFLKNNTSTSDRFDIDHIYAIEYKKTRKMSDINNIKQIDGGLLGSSSGGSGTGGGGGGSGTGGGGGGGTGTPGTTVNPLPTNRIPSNSGRFPSDTNDVVYMVMRYYTVEDNTTCGSSTKLDPSSGLYGAHIAIGFYYPKYLLYDEQDLALPDPTTGSFSSFPVGVFGTSGIVSFSDGFYNRGWIKRADGTIVGEQLSPSNSFLGIFKNIFPLSNSGYEIYNPSTNLDSEVFHLEKKLTPVANAWIVNNTATGTKIDLDSAGIIDPSNQCLVTAAIELRLRDISGTISTTKPRLTIGGVTHDDSYIYIDIEGEATTPGAKMSHTEYEIVGTSIKGSIPY